MGLWLALIGFTHPALKLERANDGVDCAGELDQHSIAHQLDDAPAAGAKDGLQNGLAPRPQRRQGSSFVRLHQATVPNHVRHHDYGETTLGCFGHGHPSPTSRSTHHAPTALEEATSHSMVASLAAQSYLG